MLQIVVKALSHVLIVRYDEYFFQNTKVGLMNLIQVPEINIKEL